MNDSSEQYKSVVRAYDDATLEDVLSHIDREAHPEKFRILAEEQDRRTKLQASGGKIPKPNGSVMGFLTPILVAVGGICIVVGAWVVISAVTLESMDEQMRFKGPARGEEERALIAQMRRQHKLLGGGAFLLGAFLVAFGRAKGRRASEGSPATGGDEDGENHGGADVGAVAGKDVGKDGGQGHGR